MNRTTVHLIFLAMSIAFLGQAAPSVLKAEDVFVTLWAGTPVSLELDEELDSRDIVQGQMIRFTVRSNVVVNGKVLIATGMTAWGRICEKKRKCDRDCAEVKISLETVQTVDGQQVFLSDSPRKMLLNCCRGGSGTLPQGTAFSARIRNDVQVEA